MSRTVRAELLRLRELRVCWRVSCRIRRRPGLEWERWRWQAVAAVAIFNHKPTPPAPGPTPGPTPTPVVVVPQPTPTPVTYAYSDTRSDACGSCDSGWDADLDSVEPGDRVG